MLAMVTLATLLKLILRDLMSMLLLPKLILRDRLWIS